MPEIESYLSYMNVDEYLPELKRKAIESSSNAFAPYSKFVVGASLLVVTSILVVMLNSQIILLFMLKSMQ